PTLTCSPSEQTTRESVEQALNGKPASEQQAILSNWFAHMRTLTGDHTIAELGITYTPDAQGRPTRDPVEANIRDNTRLLASTLARTCNSR
ncbi:MAG: hypothetical protein C0436_04015, partial [Alphaproteobacteria bacterium]|nr:hypothetical protein [Alphaproteobacteria bacterium]